MIQKSLSAILGGINVRSVRGDDHVPIRGMTYDSRKVKPGWFFCALPGVHVDGRRFIWSAVEGGATAVMYEGDLDNETTGRLAGAGTVTLVQVPDVRRAMSRCAAELWERPSEQIDTIGITGTDGKSSTVFFTHQLLTFAGVSSGFLSTVAMQTGADIVVNPFRQSTPEATEIHSILRQMVDAGKEAAVVEATSHGLSPRTSRLADVRFGTAAITNITHEHLEFHGTFEQYRDDKANLFRAVNAAENGIGIVNASDGSAAFLRSVTRALTLSYTIGSEEADVRAENLIQDSEGIGFDVVMDVSNGRRKSLGRYRLNTPGGFNVENTLASALAAAGHLARRSGSVDRANVLSYLPDILATVQRLEPVKGRLSPIRLGQPFGVMVDYAHTPGAFARVLPMMRNGLEGRLIVVFGSAGERDIAKRPLQGKAAADHADIIVLADEDPRGELPMEILEQIATGCSNRQRGKDLLLIPDRREAIRKALSLARPGDLVLLLGKGHEYSIIYSDGPRPWDEEEEARAALAALGYGDQN